MAQLSLLAEWVRKADKSKHAPGPKGFAKGSTGAAGSQFLQVRDTKAGLRKEMEYMNSPVFQQFLEGLVPQTRFAEFRRNY